MNKYLMNKHRDEKKHFFLTEECHMTHVEAMKEIEKSPLEYYSNYGYRKVSLMNAKVIVQNFKEK